MTQPKDAGREHDQAHITINKEPRVSPNPTTGSALYELGKVPEGYDLFRESRGREDDELISRDGATIEVHNGDRFFSVQSSLNPGGPHGGH